MSCVTLHSAKILAVTCVFSVLLVGNAVANPRACGPVAAFVAYRSLGFDADLDALSGDCNLDDDGSVAFDELCRLMRRDQRLVCHCGAVQLEQVNSHLRWGGVVIIAVRMAGSRVDHAFCIVGQDPAGDYVYVDASALEHRLSAAELETVRLGQAILVSASPDTQFRREWPLLILPIAALVSTASISCLYGLRSCLSKR